MLLMEIADRLYLLPRSEVPAGAVAWDPAGAPEQEGPTGRVAGLGSRERAVAEQRARLAKMNRLRRR